MTWTDARLKHLASVPIRNGLGEAGGETNLTWPRYIRTTDIAGPRKLRTDVFASLPPNVAKSAMVNRGDVLMTAAGATIGKSLLYDSFAPACFAGYLVRFRPRDDVDSRFISYWTESQDYWDQIQTGKVVSTIENFSAGKYQNLHVRVPDFRTQKAIADYLDRETARIDALIEKKRRMVELIEERESTLFDKSLHRFGVSFSVNFIAAEVRGMGLPLGWQVMHLSQTLLQLTNGYVGPTRDILVDEGIRYVQSLHIKNGSIDFARRPFFVTEQWHRERPRIHLRQGDVLIVQTGDIGQVAVVPANFGEASCHALQIARVRPDVISGEYLGEYLRSPCGRQSLLSRATGALHPHLEGGIRDVPVIVPPLFIQGEILEEVSKPRISLRKAVSSLNVQIDLLVERRRAVITAAVSGQIAIKWKAA